jgi:riboflavin transporter 2
MKKTLLHRSLNFFQAFVCFWSNGAFPAIQTYSCLPYGNTIYHLSVTLHAMANPMMAFFAFFVPCRKIGW